MPRVLTEAEAIDVVLSEREYQAVFAPAPHSKDRLLLLMEHYLLRARTDMLCPQMEEGREGSSVRKVGALAVKFISEFGAPMRVRKPGEARSAKVPMMAASPDNPLAAHLRAVLNHHDQNTCIHDDVKRGGSIWTICNQCDRKWADDEGGFQPYTDPPAIANARFALAQLDAPVVEADAACDVFREAWSDFEEGFLTDGNGGWVPAAVVAACKEAFVLAWPQGHEAAVRAGSESFYASGIPAERIGAMEDALKTPPSEVDDPAELRRTIGDLVAQISGGRVVTEGEYMRTSDTEVWNRAKHLAGGAHTMDTGA